MRDTIKLDYREDGVYLTLLKKPEDAVQVIQYIKKKNIKSADFTKISTCISVGEAQDERIAGPQEEVFLDEDVSLRMSDNVMEAYAWLVPGDPEGRKLEEGDIKREIESKYKVAHGLIDEAIRQMAEERDYSKEYLVAKGEEAQDGENAVVTYHFDKDRLEKSVFELAGDEDKIDFRNINVFQKADVGQVLVSKTAATPGVDGKNIRGGKIAARNGKDAILPAGKNTHLSEDKLSLLSKIAGRIELENGKITVSPSVRIGGDVDMSVGNITFDGDVEIMGNVNAGFEVNAGGNVTINGMVESATVISGGDIIIKNGIQGADKGLLRAKGNVIAQYIERSTVDAGANVTTEFALHSNIMSEGFVDVSQGRGTIIGGTTAATQYVVAKVIGTDAGVATNIEIGVSPQKRQRLKEVRDLLPQLDANIQRMELAVQAAGKAQDDAGGKARLQITIQIGNMKKEAGELKEELERLEKDMEDSKRGKIHVLDKIFRGAKISIGADIMQIKQESQYTTFLRDHSDRQISFTSCMYRKGTND